MTALEGINWNCHVSVDKWDDDAVAWVQRKTGLVAPKASDLARLVRPYETVEGPTPGNVLTTVGLAQLNATLLNASGQRQWVASSAGSGFSGLAVQDGTTAEAVGDTDMQGTNKSYLQCDDTFPTHSNGVITFKASWQTGDGNFAWNGYGAVVGNASASAMTGAADTTKPANWVLLNHKVSGVSLGTKASGVWALTMTLTIS